MNVRRTLRWLLIPLAIVLALFALIYTILQPALIRGRAHKSSAKLGATIKQRPARMGHLGYWQHVEKWLGKSHLEFQSFRLNNSAAPADDRDLAFLHRLDKLQKVDLVRQDVSDEFLAKLVRNLDHDYVEFDFSGTAAGEKTVQALIDLPVSTGPWGSGSILRLNATAITREDAERLRTAGFHVISWTPPVSAANRKRLQPLFPFVTYRGELDSSSRLEINLKELTPETINTLGELTGTFEAMILHSGELDNELASNIVRGKDASAVSLDDVAFEHLGRVRR